MKDPLVSKQQLSLVSVLKGSRNTLSSVLVVELIGGGSDAKVGNPVMRDFSLEIIHFG